MPRYTIRTGDGNNGCARRETIVVPDIDEAAMYALEFCNEPNLPMDLSFEDGDENYLSIYWLTNTRGQTAYNGGSYYIIEIERESDNKTGK